MLAASDIPALLAHHTRRHLPPRRRDRDLTKAGADIRPLEGDAGRAADEAHRLVPHAGREGGLQALHAQGDSRATARRRRHAARARRLRGARGRRARRLAPRRSSRSRSRGSTSSRAGRARTPRWRVATGSSSSRSLPSQVEIGSEVRYREPVFTENDLVVAVSQSGETADTLAAVKAAKSPGRAHPRRRQRARQRDPARVDGALYTHAGPEIGVASTKCFTTQLAALLLLAVYLGRAAGHAPRGQAQAHPRRAHGAPSRCAPCSRRRTRSSASPKYVHARDMLFLGRGHRLPDRARGGVEAQGDLVHPRRGVRGGRDEARAHRAHRRGDAGGRRVPEGRALREDDFEHAGGEGARGAAHRGLHRGRRATWSGCSQSDRRQVGSTAASTATRPT